MHPCRRLYLWVVGLCVSYVNKDTGYTDGRSLVNSLNLPRQIAKYKLTREHDHFLPNTFKLSVHYGTVICLRIISVIIASLNKLYDPSRPVCFIPLSNSRHHPLVHSRHACAGERTNLMCSKSLLRTKLHEDTSHKQTLRCPQQRSQCFTYTFLILSGEEFCLLNSTKQIKNDITLYETKEGQYLKMPWLSPFGNTCIWLFISILPQHLKAAEGMK